MDEETRDHKQRLLNVYQENLRELEIQSAQFGSTPPLHIINQIKHHRKEISQLQAELRTNAEEVTFDRLLIGIEELQKFVRDEGIRAVEEYNRAFGDEAEVEMGLIAPLSGGVLATMGIDYLYRQYVKGGTFADQYNLVSILIYATGLSLSGYITFRLGKFISDSKYEIFIHRLGYDPFAKQRARRRDG